MAGGLVVLAAVVVGALALLRGGLATGRQAEAVPLVAATSQHDPYPQVFSQSGEIRLPVSAFADGEAHYFTYMHGDHPIEFFVLKSDDGVVRAAFNACDVCYSSKKGYSQDGDEMVCNNCGLRFAEENINVLKGGCNPSPLDRTIDGESLVIKESDIVDGLRYFS
jgi:uncharacterized membrane protein